MLEFEDMEKMRQFFEQEEQRRKEKKTPNAPSLEERRQRLAERRQDLAERKQRQREQQTEQRHPEPKKEKGGSGALLFCVLGFVAIIVEVIFCLCILCKY